MTGSDAILHEIAASPILSAALTLLLQSFMVLLSLQIKTSSILHKVIKIKRVHNDQTQ